MSLSDEEKKSLEKFLNAPFMEGHVKVEWRRGFRNFMHTQRQQDAIVIDVESKIALGALLMKIQGMNKNKNPDQRIVVRAAAGGRTDVKNSASYSATAVTSADIVIRLTGKEFSQISRLPKNTARKTQRVRVGASLQIGELDKKLSSAEKDEDKLITPTSSLIPYVTVAGLAAPGGHGTGRNQPSFAGLIRGATFMLENGKEIHIDDTHPDFATIMGANNGLFGILLDVDIECTPAKKMQCVMERRSVAEFMEEIENGLFLRDEYVSAMYVPTYLPDEMTNTKVENVVIFRYKPVPLDTPDVNHSQTTSEFSQELETKLGNTANLAEILRNYPCIVPYFMRHLAAPLSVGKRDELKVGPWHELMHYRTSFPESLDETCGIIPVQDELRDAKHGAEIIATIKKTINHLAESAARGEYPVNYGLYFRFIKGTKGGLSPTAVPEGSHACAIDITTIEGAPGFDRMKAEMQEFFLNEMKGKFHWGKNAPMDLDYQKIYGENWIQFKNALERWYQTNHLSLPKSALMNPLFSQALGLPVPSLVDTHTMPLVVESFARKYQTTLQARKLVDLLNTTPEEHAMLVEKLNSEIDKHALKSNTLFAGNKQTVTAKEEEKGFCHIL